MRAPRRRRLPLGERTPPPPDAARGTRLFGPVRRYRAPRAASGARGTRMDAGVGTVRLMPGDGSQRPSLARASERQGAAEEPGAEDDRRRGDRGGREEDHAGLGGAEHSDRDRATAARVREQSCDDAQRERGCDQRRVVAEASIRSRRGRFRGRGSQRGRGRRCDRSVSGSGRPCRPATTAAAKTASDAWTLRRSQPRAGCTANGTSARPPTGASSGPAANARPVRGSRQPSARSESAIAP